MSLIVVDASVAVRILSREAGAEIALKRIGGADTRCAPDWIRLEVANAMARKVRQGVIAQADALATAAAVGMLVDEQVDSVSLISEAFDLSVRLKHPMYDCLYLAAAMRFDGMMVTTDQKFTSVAQTAGFDRRVELLA